MLCPVCGKYKFEKKGSYDICPVCHWENDRLQENDHNYVGGANSLSVNESLIEYFLLNYASSKDIAKKIRGEYSLMSNEINHKYAKPNQVSDHNLAEQKMADYMQAREDYLNKLSELLMQILEQ